VRRLLSPAAIVLGVVAERSAYGVDDARHWLPDLAVGWTLIACGLLAWSRRPESRSGPLLAVTGFIWFAGNFTTTGLAAVDWLSAHAIYLYRGPLVHLVLTYPRGRSRGRVDYAAVALAYAAAVVTPVWQSEAATIVLAAVFLAIATRAYLVAVGRERRLRLAAWQATAGLALAFGIAAVHLAVPPASSAWDLTLLLYEIALCMLAAGLLVGLLEAPWTRREMSDLVVELGETRSGTVRDALARAVGDPTLRVGYLLPETGAYVDAAGRRLDLSHLESGSAVTYLERDGERFAVLVHDPAVLDDPDLVAGVETASRLAASNARLQADVREQLGELEAARRRLVESGDRERRRLEERLRKGAERRLLALGGVLELARRRRPHADVAVRIENASDQLERTLVELGDLARGLHPRVLVEEGLAGALGSLVGRSPVPVDVSLPDDVLPSRIEAAVYFVCSEALTNAAKYASASRVTVAVSTGSGAVRVEVVDDGLGGADPARGTGLVGLVDRVEALGGRLDLDSPPGAGTRVTARIPVG
jgi:signal transduction histidine kinase